ncbi:unnamed protein product [Musa acuminata subsp. burmannicoides]
MQLVLIEQNVSLQDWPSVLFRWFWCPLLLECCHMSISQSLLSLIITLTTDWSYPYHIAMYWASCSSLEGSRSTTYYSCVALLHAAAFALGYWCSRLSSFGNPLALFP